MCRVFLLHREQDFCNFCCKPSKIKFCIEGVSVGEICNTLLDSNEGDLSPHTSQTIYFSKTNENKRSDKEAPMGEVVELESGIEPLSIIFINIRRHSVLWYGIKWPRGSCLTDNLYQCNWWRRWYIALINQREIKYKRVMTQINRMRQLTDHLRTNGCKIHTSFYWWWQRVFNYSNNKFDETLINAISGHRSAILKSIWNIYDR